MIEWKYIAVVLCIFLLVILLLIETKRKNKSHLLLRILATATAAVSLACLAFPVVYAKKQTTSASKNVIVLTDGYNADSVHKFLSQHQSEIPVITFDKNVYDKHQFNVQYMPDIGLLSHEKNDNNIYHLFGFGLDKHEMNSLQQNHLYFHPSPLPSGIVAVNWPHQPASGDKLIVQGMYNNASSAKAKIILRYFGVALDSSYIDANKKEEFSIRTIPKGVGRLSYSLAAIAGNDTIELETLPVQVQRGKKISVLMLSSSPDFDTKFIKNLLASQGHSVVARTIISKNKYASDFLNAQQISLDRITASLLDNFNVVIADATALSSLPKGEEAAIQSQIAQKGLGLLIKGDSAVASSFYSALFPVRGGAKDSSQLLSLSLSDTDVKLPSLATANSFFIGAAHAQPLVQDKQNKVYASVALWGLGKIVFTSLHNTYLWALSGGADAYNQYWSLLLNKAVTKPPEDEWWQVSPALPVVNSPVEIRLQTNRSQAPQALINGALVSLKNNFNLPYLWSGFYNPQKEGWQTGVGLDGKPWYWYAYEKTDWQNVARSQKIIAAQRFISTNLYEETNGANQVTQQAEFPPVYFFLLFLFSCSYLWWERKQQVK